MRLTEEELRQVVSFGREQQGIEFKGPGARDDHRFLAKVVRAMLSMANRADGGRVLIGIEEDDAGKPAIGHMTPAQLQSWKHDDLADSVSSYADPRLEFDSYNLTVDAKAITVIDVAGFADVPVICKRPYVADKTSILKDGALYIRPPGKTESREINCYDEMRALVDLATEKGVRRFINMASRAGLDLGLAAASTDDALFATERGDL